MVLDHVAHLPGPVEVTPAPFNTHLFRDGDFDVIDGAAVPVIDKQGVGEAQRQQVEDRLFTEIVVDTVDLTLFKNSPTRSLISREVSSEVPSGFSMTTRAGLALSFASPSPLQIAPKVLGGIAK